MEDALSNVLHEITGYSQEECQKTLLLNNNDLSKSIKCLANKNMKNVSNIEYKHGEFSIIEVKKGDYKYLTEEHQFSISDIAKMVNKECEEVNAARIRLNLNSKNSFSQKESALMIDYISEPEKYETNEDGNVDVLHDYQKESTDFAFLFGVGTVLIAGLAFILTRNSAATRSAFLGSNSVLRGTHAAYALAGTTATYPIARSFLNTTIIPSIIGFVSTRYGISPVLVGPRGGIYRYTLSGLKSYL